MLTPLFIAIITDESPIVGTTREAVIAEVAAYAIERWDTCTDDPLPDNNEAIVRKYFSDNEDEYLKITEHAVPALKYQIMGPDGITTVPHAYESLDELVQGAANFICRFIHQGYYSGLRDRIPLAELPAYLSCIVVADEDEGEVDEDAIADHLAQAVQSIHDARDDNADEAMRLSSWEDDHGRLTDAERAAVWATANESCDPPERFTPMEHGDDGTDGYTPDDD